MADGNLTLTEKEIADLEADLAKKQKELDDARAAVDEKIRAARAANASKVFDEVMALLNGSGHYFGTAQKNKISSFFDKAPKAPKAPKEDKPKSDKPDQYILTSGPNKGDTWGGQGKVVKSSFAAWHASDDGKAFVKKTLASEEGKAWLAANSVDGKVKADEKGQARGPFPINPAYVEWKKAKDASKAK
ncbi:hypothetical protein [Pseudoxanthomonas winnipegensis]|uniref:hypothetical protein n=1 Tax=Pseudoxanthomonas winnipegensis TaxID=2480810 RepID=UPI00103C8A81|nr:hypothetical protein [Pseudoxanthomonas winnipegensis]TBV69754.1 hypothetical protein EYC45_19080 [Pseudoxanthomonas winnipegensis]